MASFVSGVVPINFMSRKRKAKRAKARSTKRPTVAVNPSTSKPSFGSAPNRAGVVVATVGPELSDLGEWQQASEHSIDISPRGIQFSVR